MDPKTSVIMRSQCISNLYIQAWFWTPRFYGRLEGKGGSTSNLLYTTVLDSKCWVSIEKIPLILYVFSIN